MGQIIDTMYTGKNSTVAFTDILMVALQPSNLAYLASVNGENVDFMNATITQYIKCALYIESLLSQPMEPPTIQYSTENV